MTSWQDEHENPRADSRDNAAIDAMRFVSWLFGSERIAQAVESRALSREAYSDLDDRAVRRCDSLQ